MLRVVTAHATYVVDRERNVWCRNSVKYPKSDDNQWIRGGFTLAEVGGRCYAHYENGRADGAPGRWTGSVVSIEEE